MIVFLELFVVLGGGNVLRMRSFVDVFNIVCDLFVVEVLWGRLGVFVVDIVFLRICKEG